MLIFLRIEEVLIVAQLIGIYKSYALIFR